MVLRAAAAVALLALGTAALGLAACAPVAGEALERDDPFQPFREYAAPRFKAGDFNTLVGVSLIARVDRASGAVAPLLKVEIAYRGRDRRSYETARNARAEALAVTSLARAGTCHGAQGCNFSEVFTVALSEPDLKAAAAPGYALKIYPKIGPEILVVVPTTAIADVLGRVDRDRRSAATGVSVAQSTPPTEKSKR